MAQYHVFCDESHIGPHTYRVQGGIWADNAGMRVIRRELKALRTKHPTLREVKWSEIHGTTPYRAYGDLVSLFFDGPAAQFLSFKCMVINKVDDASRGLDSDGRDLGFYKTYFTLFRYRCLPGCQYRIHLDEKPGTRVNPEADVALHLNKKFGKWKPPAEVLSCKGVCSKTEDLVQLADLFCGAVGWDWNGRQSISSAKVVLATQIIDRLGWSTLARETTIKEPKFNIWRYRPK